MNYPKYRRIRAEIERLAAEADELPEGEARKKIVDQIAILNIDIQALD
jgi:hypothetical protein